MKVIFNYFLLFLSSSFILLLGCGIEDSIYFQEPKNIYIDDNETNKVLVKFKGYNQEEDSDYFLLVGYDVYYYFVSGQTPLKATVYKPYYSQNENLLDLTNDNYDFGIESKKIRFPSNFFKNMDDFYKYTTIPVTLDMIETVLTDKDDNVRFCFHNDKINDLSSDTNPYKTSDNRYIILDNLYPNPSEYEDKTWYDGDIKENFLGFYDYNYYQNLNITPVAEDGADKIYRMYIYIVAKGFNSSEEIDRNPNYIESSKSVTIQVRLRVSTL